MLRLRYETPAAAYQQAVLAELDVFLQDHAANERKVSQAALKLAVEHPGRPELCATMIELAQEELRHFQQVYEILAARGCSLARDVPDPYMGSLRRALRRQTTDEFLLDRLVLFSIIEARGCERFSLVADCLPAGELRTFYEDLVRSEARHHTTYLRLAHLYFGDAADARLDQFLDLEASVARARPLRAALY